MLNDGAVQLADADVVAVVGRADVRPLLLEVSDARGLVGQFLRELRAGVGSVVSPQRKSTETPSALAAADRLATDRLERPCSTIEMSGGVAFVPAAS